MVEKTVDGCWLWKGTLCERGYGRFVYTTEKHEIVQILAHRYSFQIHTGIVPPEGVPVLQDCDNPGCVNPEHVFMPSYDDRYLALMRRRADSRKKRKAKELAGD
jgi:hypothetical protein